MPGRVCHGDNLEILGALAEGSVDLVYADPPYGTGTRRAGAAAAYDDRTPDGLPGYLAWLRPRLVECRRILAPTGSLFVHLDWRAVHHVKVALDELFGGDHFVNELVWCYSVGGKSARAFGRKHDTILWYARTAAYAFYPDAVRVARKPGSHMRVERDADGRPVQVKRDARTGKVYRYPVHEGKIPEDYWTDIETLNRSDRERTGYPTQKPEALLERIVRATTKPGDFVVDPFCGSGTTAVVAERLGRRFLVADASADAVRTARERLSRLGSVLS